MKNESWVRLVRLYQWGIPIWLGGALMCIVWGIATVWIRPAFPSISAALYLSISISMVILVFLGISCAHLPQALWKREVGKRESFPLTRNKKNEFREQAKKILEVTERLFLASCDKQESARGFLSRDIENLEEINDRETPTDINETWKHELALMNAKAGISQSNEVLKFWTKRLQKTRKKFYRQWALFAMLGITPTHYPHTFLMQVKKKMEAEDNAASKALES